MNSWKLNSNSNFILKSAICSYFNIPFEEYYKKVKQTDKHRILTNDGKIFEVTLKEIL